MLLFPSLRLFQEDKSLKCSSFFNFRLKSLFRLFLCLHHSSLLPMYQHLAFYQLLIMPYLNLPFLLSFLIGLLLFLFYPALKNTNVRRKAQLDPNNSE